jgi:AhpD family alkylhydroperoxidase
MARQPRATVIHPRVPLVDLAKPVEERLQELGGRPINLYRALANQPDMLACWIEFAWAVRLRCRLPRRLRELMIVRAARLTGCPYEQAHHNVMARQAGATSEELGALDAWRDSTVFSRAERAALAYMEAMIAGTVSDEVAAELARHYNAADRIELVLTAALYCMVPRVIDALAIPLDATDEALTSDRSYDPLRE